MPQPRRHRMRRSARSVPTRSRCEEPEADEDGLPHGWMEWGGELVFVAGFTSGGAPYGVRVQDFPAEDLPEELKEVAEERRAEEIRLSALAAEQRAGFGREDRDVPF